MDEFFKISEYQGVSILRCDAGARRELFDEAGVPATGTMLEAVVFYLCENAELEEFPIEFDSDNDMFAAYSEDKKHLLQMCELLNRSFSEDDVLRNALAADEVQEAAALENSLNSLDAGGGELYSQLGLDKKGELSPEDISDVLKSLF